MMLDHVQLPMPHGREDAARAFFCNVLGMNETLKPEALRSRGGCWFQLGPCHVHLGVDPDFRAQKKAHPAFLIHDLNGLAKKLVDAGHSVKHDHSVEGIERFFSHDPFGNRLEFIRKGQGFGEAAIPAIGDPGSGFHHAALPRESAFLAGRGPVIPGVGVQTEHLQMYYRRGDDLSIDASSHAHTRCDEFILVISGSIDVDVEGEEHTIAASEFCHFPAGLFHKIVGVDGPLEALVIRAPSVEDKMYKS